MDETREKLIEEAMRNAREDLMRHTMENPRHPDLGPVLPLTRAIGVMQELKDALLAIEPADPIPVYRHPDATDEFVSTEGPKETFQGKRKG